MTLTNDKKETQLTLTLSIDPCFSKETKPNPLFLLFDKFLETYISIIFPYFEKYFSKSFLPASNGSLVTNIRGYPFRAYISMEKRYYTTYY